MTDLYITQVKVKIPTVPLWNEWGFYFGWHDNKDEYAYKTFLVAHRIPEFHLGSVLVRAGITPPFELIEVKRMEVLMLDGFCVLPIPIPLEREDDEAETEA